MKKLNKQTVYLPVNGEQEKVICHDYPDWMDKITGVLEKEGYFFTPEQLNEYTKNVIKQSLEAAAEKAEIEDIGGIGRDGEYHEHNIVNKQSITNTFEETYSKLKV